ncbi:uncharacterized protein LOC125542615 isoform X2 [Triticum urartu]|uniref:uncharacterized protein LOC125542615 isoform X2 n=1 Tax=Triticum urartu TaxID=4572 RepID=UPI002043D5B3|nr:uncharacterized protein LOC125542615 isoform X2 [Triticum urartu]
MANQPQPRRRAPVPVVVPAPLPAPAPARVREIMYEDTFLASETVEPTGLDIPEKAPLAEKTVWKWNREIDTTGNDMWDLVKQQCFNKSNLLGNKRREVLPLLSASKAKRKKNRSHVNKLRNEVDGLKAQLAAKIADFNQFVPGGLKAQLAAKIADFNQFVPGGFEMPRHFNEFPALED